MGAPQRYADGVTNIGKAKTLSEMPMLDPTKVYGYFNDFFEWTATDWIVSTIEAGAGAATEAISDTETGGAVVITNDAGADDFDFFQLSRDGGINDSEVFYFATGKKAWFKIRFKGNDVDQSEYMAGIHIVNADPRNAAPTDGVWFESDDETGQVDLVIVKDSSRTVASGICTMIDDTYVSLGYYWDGVTTVHYFVNDVEIGSIGVGTSLPDDEYLALSFGHENGEAVANTMTVDYIGAWMER